jgi:hypothetical protein
MSAEREPQSYDVRKEEKHGSKPAIGLNRFDEKRIAEFRYLGKVTTPTVGPFRCFARATIELVL